MTVDEVFHARHAEWSGRIATSQEADRLRQGPLHVPEWLIEALGRYPVIGATMTLDETEDESGIGVEMRWLSPADMQTEAVDLYPGSSAAVLGYLPIGECLEGSGDPYFLSDSTRDPSLVRIPHDAIKENGALDQSRVEIVAGKLSDFLLRVHI